MMSDEENFNSSETAAGKTETVFMAKPAKVKRYRAPLIIAACIFFASVLFFGCWKCFFDTSILGTWGVEMISADGNNKLEYTLTFNNDKTVSLHSGGVSYTGRYYFVDNEDKGSVVSIYINNSGVPFVAADFGYDFEGNIFTGRSLKLTDYSGMFFTPDTASSDQEQVKEKQKITASTEKDGVIYYIWDFRPSQEIFKTEAVKDAKTDKALLGSWIFREEDSDYSYTITFEEDGSFEQLSYDSDLRGTYSADGESCTLCLYDLSGEKNESSLSYEINGSKLTLNSVEFTKTDNKFAYQSDVQ